MKRRTFLVSALAISGIPLMARATSYDPTFAGVKGVVISINLIADVPSTIAEIESAAILQSLVAEAEASARSSGRDIRIFTLQSYGSKPATLLDQQVLFVQVRVSVSTLSDLGGKSILVGAAGLFLQRKGYPSYPFNTPQSFFLVSESQRSELYGAIQSATAAQVQTFMDQIVAMNK